jgi:hypothetical protein
LAQPSRPGRGLGQISEQVVAQKFTHRCQIGAPGCDVPVRQTKLAAEATQALGVAGVIGMVRREIQKQVRRLRPIDHDQLVIVTAPDARAIQQEVEFGEGGDGGGAIGKHLHIPGRLVEVAVLQMPPRCQQRARRDRIAQTYLLEPIRRGWRAAEQGHVTGGDPVGNVAKGRLVALAKDGATTDRDAHPRIERSGRARHVAEMGTRERAVAAFDKPICGQPIHRQPRSMKPYIA